MRALGRVAKNMRARVNELDGVLNEIENDEAWVAAGRRRPHSG